MRNGYPYRFDESSTCEQIGEDEKGLLLEEIRGNEYLSAGKTVTFARDGYYQREIIILVLHTAEMRAGTGIWRDFSSDFRLLAMGPFIT